VSELGPNNYRPTWPAAFPETGFYTPVIGDGNVYRKLTNLVGDDLPPLAQILSTFNAPVDFIDGDSTIDTGRSGIFMSAGIYTATFDATSITLPTVHPGPSPIFQGYIFRPNILAIAKARGSEEEMLEPCTSYSLATTTRLLTLTPRATDYFKWTGLNSTTVTIELFQALTVRSIFAIIRGMWGTGGTTEGSDGDYYIG